MRTAVLDPPTELISPPFRLADGVELVGPYQGSGYRERRYVIVRGDGQVVQVSELLYRLASAIDGRSGPGDLARRVRADTGRELAAGDVDGLVRERLVPAGLIEDGAAAGDDTKSPSPAPRRADHLLMLRFRLPVVPAAVTWPIAGAFRWLHRPAVVVAMLVAVLAVDIAVVAGAGITRAVAGATDLVTTPSLVLAVFGLVLAAGAFHECGHVSACRYGGARPGPMGVGIYLVWPAFYSTVTDSYRLSRAGRLRTDLGGVYFNAIVLGVLGAVHLTTGADWLLVVLALLHLETVRQFLPMIRLDGYYILSDIVGVPDLFSYLGPVLRNRLPGAKPDPRLERLRPGVRRTVELWVALVVPVLVVVLGGFLLAAPAVLPEIVGGARRHLDAAAAGVRSGATAEAALGAVRAALLVLPVVGAALLVGLMLRRLGRTVLSRLVESSARTDREIPTLVGAVLPVLLIGMLAVAGSTVLGTPAPSWDPLAAGERQLAAVTALGGGTAPAVAGVLAGALAAVLLWPLGRRLGMPPSIAGLAVVLAGATPPLVVLQAGADPAAPAAVWLVLAALLAGRGPAAARIAYLALVIAAVTAPVAGVALAAFVAHGVWTRQLGRRLRPAGRWVTTVLATAVAALGSGLLAGSAPAGPLPDAGLVALIVVGALVVLLTVRCRRPLAPVGTGAVVLLALAAVPGTRTAALLLLGPVLAMLGAGLADRVLPRDRPAWAGGVLAATVLVLFAGTGPLVGAASAAASTSSDAGPATAAVSGVAPEASVPRSVVAPTDG